MGVLHSVESYTVTSVILCYSVESEDVLQCQNLRRYSTNTSHSVESNVRMTVILYFFLKKHTQNSYK